MNERDLAKFLKRCRNIKNISRVLAGASMAFALICAEVIGVAIVYEDATKRTIEEQNT